MKPAAGLVKGVDSVLVSSLTSYSCYRSLSGYDFKNWTEAHSVFSSKLAA